MQLLVLLLSIAGTHAFKGLFNKLIIDEITGSFEQTEEPVPSGAAAEPTQFVQSYIHIVDATLITVIAWAVVVVVSPCVSFMYYDI